MMTEGDLLAPRGGALGRGGVKPNRWSSRSQMRSDVAMKPLPMNPGDGREEKTRRAKGRWSTEARRNRMG